MLRIFMPAIILAMGVSAVAVLASAQTAALTDGQILEYVQTVNKGEVADARMALKRSKSADVKTFAKHMVDDHSKSEKTISALAKHSRTKLAKSDLTTALVREAKAGDKQLKASKGGEFDKQYAEAQAKMHGEVADTIQNQLVPAASGYEIKSALSDTLSTVKEHLQMAQDLSGKL